jgi:colanic acid/amylovoran biosynthesis glycosyltransferase
MRIAYLVNQYPKVSHTFIRREIHALERQGVDVIRISLRGWNEPLTDADDFEERIRTRYVLKEGALSLGIAALQIGLRSPLKFWQALTLTIRMARRSERPLLVHLVYLVEACRIMLWLEQDNATHIHAHFGTNSAEVAMFVNLLGGLPWSFTVHGPEEFDKPRALSLAEKVQRAAFVVAVSSFGRSQIFRTVHHTHWPKVHVVRCGLERNFFADQDCQTSSKSLVCIGRLCEQKGQLLLVEAVRLLRQNGTEVKLILAGDGELRREIEDLIRHHKLEENIEITGWVSSQEVRQYLLAARALVLPSFAEGLPIVIMEAMALRRPVISTFVAGIPELVSNGEHGWLVPAGDLEALAGAMQNCLVASHYTLNTMANSAFEKVTELHDIDQQAAKLEKLFRITGHIVLGKTTSGV